MSKNYSASPSYKTLVYLLIVTFLLPGPLLGSHSAFADEKVKIVVKDLEPRSGVHRLLAEELTKIIRDSVNETGKYTVVASENGPHRLIVGTIEKTGDSFTVELKLLDGEKARIINSYFEKIEKALPNRIKEAASALVLEMKPSIGNSETAAGQGPKIQHSPLTSKMGKEEIVILASVTASHKIREVNLHYRIRGTQQYETELMKETGGGQYEGFIPKNEVTEEGIEYYLEAFDVTGNRASDGTLALPHPVSVEMVAASKKSNWWKWALGIVVVGGLAAAALGGGGGSGGDTDPGGSTGGGVSVSW